jgi:hypothetical protein
MLIAKGAIPRIIALGLYLLKGWRCDENFNLISRGRLLAGFWINLRNECPRLRTLMLRNIGNTFTEPLWLTGPVIDEINNLSVSNQVGQTRTRYLADMSESFGLTPGMDWRTKRRRRFEDFEQPSPSRIIIAYTEFKGRFPSGNSLVLP